MPRAEARNPFIISDQRAGELDCGSNQEPIRRIAVLEMMELVAAGGSLMAEWHRFDAGTLEEAPDPSLNGNVEIDPPCVHK